MFISNDVVIFCGGEGRRATFNVTFKPGYITPGIVRTLIYGLVVCETLKCIGTVPVFVIVIWHTLDVSGFTRPKSIVSGVALTDIGRERGADEVLGLDGGATDTEREAAESFEFLEERG